MNILIKTPDDEDKQGQQKYWDFDTDVTFDESNSALLIVIMTTMTLMMRVMNAWNIW